MHLHRQLLTYCPPHLYLRIRCPASAAPLPRLCGSGSASAGQIHCPGYAILAPWLRHTASYSAAPIPSPSLCRSAPTRLCRPSSTMQALRLQLRLCNSSTAAPLHGAAQLLRFRPFALADPSSRSIDDRRPLDNCSSGAAWKSGPWWCKDTAPAAAQEHQPRGDARCPQNHNAKAPAP